jgi:hypothetical protein
MSPRGIAKPDRKTAPGRVRRNQQGAVFIDAFHQQGANAETGCIDAPL